MDNKKRIELYNRYYNNVYLEQISVDEYQLHGPVEIFNYMRIGFNNDKKNIDYTDINFIDPDGGPFLSIGTKLNNNLIISHITCMKIENKAIYVIKIKKEDQK